MLGSILKGSTFGADSHGNQHYRMISSSSCSAPLEGPPSAATKGPTEDCTRSHVKEGQKLLAKRAATTEVPNDITF